MNDLHKYAFDYRNAVLPDDAHEAWKDLEEHVRELIAAEREACAKFAAEYMEKHEGAHFGIADAIRARREK